MSRKNYSIKEGSYYFMVKSGQQNIMIYRNDEKTARDAYQNYVKVGKNCEWLGMWDGKNFSKN